MTFDITDFRAIIFIFNSVPGSLSVRIIEKRAGDERVLVDKKETIEKASARQAASTASGISLF